MSETKSQVEALRVYQYQPRVVKVTLIWTKGNTVRNKFPERKTTTLLVPRNSSICFEFAMWISNYFYISGWSN